MRSHVGTGFFAIVCCFVAAVTVTGAASAQDAAPPRQPGVRVDACSMTQTASYASYIQAGWANGPATRKGSFIVASDPQFPRVTKADGVEYSDPAASESRLVNIFGVISGMRSVSSYVPVIINGDLTEYGHGYERLKLQTLFPLMRGRTPGPLFFPGLGNHDYVGNVGDCANNGCARDSICDLVTWVNEIQPSAGAPKSLDFKLSEDLLRGSLGYSFNIGDLHFIELNDSPVHASTFKSKIDGFWGEVTYRIDPSLRWLEGDLREARRMGKIIFVNMHKRDEWPHNQDNARFVKLMEGYGVSAVFAGHMHRQLGEFPTPARFGSVPAFQSGGLLDGSLLYVEYDAGAKTANINSYKLGQGMAAVRTIPLKAGTSLPEVSTFLDSEITFYEGNSATQKVVCDVMLAGNPKFNMNGTYGCSNDEARSLIIHKAQKGTMITLYGNYNHNGDEGYAVIEVTQDILQPMLVGTFNPNYTASHWKLTRYGPNTLDGKISSVAVGPRDYRNGWMTLYEGNDGKENVVCTESVSANRSFNLGGKCANDEARSVRFHMVKAGLKVCFFGAWNQQDHEGWSCMGTYRNFDDLLVGTFEYPVDIPGQYWVWRHKTIDGKVSSVEITGASKQQREWPRKWCRRPFVISAPAEIRRWCARR